MRASLANKNSFDPCAADRTLLIFPCIDSKIILELTTAIDPVEGGAVTADTLKQDTVDRCVQRLGLFRRY
jgi:hypothetical protein